MNIEPGTRTGRRAGSCSRVHSRSKPASLGTSIPKEDAAAGGMASFLSFAGAVSLRLRRDSGRSRTKQTGALVLAIHRQVHAESSRTSMSTSTSTLTSTLTSTMNEPFQVKHFHRHLSGEQRNIPVGVMQAVLMHALQLRRSCREVFLLCDIQRHSLADAAMILGISQVVAKRRLRLARRRMNDVIERLCGPIREVAGPKSE